MPVQGLGNAIIVIRGVDLLSKEVDRMASRYATNLAKLQRANAGLVAQGLPVPVVDRLTEATLRATVAVTNLRARWQGLASTISATGLMTTALVSAPIFTGLVSATKTTIEYEKSLRNIQSIGRQTEAQLESLGQKFIGMSTDISKTVASPQELAEAFYEIQSAAFYGADAQKILDASTMAATAGLADQVETAKAVAVALKSYNDSADNATSYTDKMARAVDIGIFRFEDLTAQMGDFIGAAGMLKVPFEDTMAAMTAMTKRGIKPSEAATSLNRILMTYLKPSNAQLDLAQFLGIDLSAKSLKKGLGPVLADIWKKTGGSEELIAQLFSEMRGVRGAFALLSDGLSLFNTDLEILKNSAGSVRQIFDIQTKSFSAQLQNLKNNITAIAIALGEQLLPIIMEFVNVNLKPLINQFARLSDESRGKLLKLALALAALGPVLIVLGTVMNSSAVIATVLSRALLAPVTMVAKLGASVLGLATAFKGVAAGAAGVGAVFSGVLGIFGAVAGILVTVAAVATAATVGFYLWKENVLGLAEGLSELSRRADSIGAIAVQLEAILMALDSTGFASQWTVIWGEMESGIDIVKILGEAFRAVALLVVDFKRTIQALYLNFSILGEYAQIAAVVVASGFALMAESVQNVLKGVLHLAGAMASLVSRDFGGALNQAALGLSSFTDIVKDINNFRMGAVPEVIDAWAKGTKQVKVYEKALEQVEKQYQIEKKTLEELDLARIRYSRRQPTGPGRGLPGVDIEDTPDNIARQYGNAVADAMSQMQSQLGDAVPPLLPGPEVDLSGLEDQGTEAKKAGEDLAQEIIDGIQSKLDEGSQFSVNLGDLRGGTFGGGPLAPGANGPFEALYRLQDIAMNLGKPTEGKDTKKWYQMYFDGEGFEQAAAKAMQIVKDFQFGNFTPDVQKFIDEQALVDAINMETVANESKKAYAEAIAKAHPELNKKILDSYLGIGTNAKGGAVVPDMTPTAQAVQASMTDAVLNLQSNPDNLLKLLGIDKDANGKLVIPNASGVAQAIHSQISAALEALPPLALDNLSSEIALTYGPLPAVPVLPDLTRQIELVHAPTNTLPEPVLSPIQRLVTWLYDTFTLPTLPVATVLVGWLIEKLVLPVLPALMQVVKFIHEKFVAPQLPVLTLIVGWLIERFVAPVLPALTLAVKFVYERFVAPILPALTQVIDFVYERFIAPSLPVLTLVVGWLIEKFVAPALPRLTAWIGWLYENFELPQVPALQAIVEWTYTRFVVPVLPKLEQLIGFKWDALTQPVLPTLFQIIAFKFGELILPRLTPLIQGINLVYGPLPQMALPSLIQTVILNFVLAFPEESATVGGFFSTLKEKIKGKLQEWFGGGTATSLAPDTAPIMGSLLTSALSLGADTLDLSALDVVLSTVQGALNKNAATIATLDYARNMLMLDRPDELAALASSVIPILANGLSVALAEDESLYNAGMSAGRRFGAGFRMGTTESVNFRGVVRDVVYSILAED